MTQKTTVKVGLGVAIILYLMSTTKAFSAIVKNQKFRGEDSKGSGQFSAPRSHGTPHQGIDIVVAPDQAILSPISGKVTRYPFPYPDDNNYFGIEIKNEKYTVKMFYLKANVSIGTIVNKGTVIGKAQNLQSKFGKGMTNHVHFEVRNAKGELINPTNMF